ncbi:BMP family ABC transporter substrate-binding protein [Sinanaerobacter chloroacetimidivorans]|jgi:basic membrane protein A|uniref:BMP family ABC transporter substrate-binding protein n=1 Tax=Sinanaerobacter chloroacetimidivorans TaxID=2818044 RepID=A0A8J8AZI4_9FIRM|nr:BMP family ABC transporter substrate-binding protein [Sinanaerobacter chloroacetimidivorans]MBR0596558.1 BMP family ABC transporter substrate-binding protein [Sinanaerobacter chloroacetimidivorans]
MKKRISLILCLLLLSMAMFTACGSSNEPAGQPEGDGEALKVVCLLNGNLGDKSFFDSANQGMKMIKEQLGVDTKVVEMGFDNTVWESTLYEFADSDYDVIIVGTYQMQELLAKVAPEYPDKKFIIFDSEVEGDNVYSITFKQNEASYLAGALAAMMADDASLTNGKNLIGAVSAMDIPVLNDFLVGYIQGATDTVPDTKVAISYIGDFADTARAKELATAQYNMGASICMHVAAQAGLGVIDAAKSLGTYAIGVDADQAMALSADDPKASAQIVTSVLKNIDQVLYRAIEKHLDGTLPYGTTEALGMEEMAVGIADNDIYRGIATEEMIAKAADLQAKIESGDIKVKSAFEMSTEEIAAYKASVEPK